MADRLKTILENFVKTGEFSPQMINVGGTLRPEETDKFIDLVVKRSPILSQVTVDRSNRLIKDVNVWELAKEKLVRIPEGARPEDYVSIGNVGKQLTMLPAQLFSMIPFSFLRDNKHRSNIETLVAGKLAELYGNDVVRLAFVGIADDFLKGDETKGAFSHLNKGWPQIVKEATGSHKLDATDYVESTGMNWKGLFSAMLAQLPDSYKSDTVRFIVNTGDAEQYAEQVGELSGAYSILLGGKALQYLNYELVPVNEMPRGTVLLTPMQNLIYGVNTNMERYRELKGEERAISYTYDSNFDFQVAVDDAAVIAYAMTAAESTDPSITSALTANGTVDIAFSYTISGKNLTGAVFTAAGLPPGLSINSSSGIIAGTPAAADTYNVTIMATVDTKSVSKTLVITIAAD